MYESKKLEDQTKHTGKHMKLRTLPNKLYHHRCYAYWPSVIDSALEKTIELVTQGGHERESGVKGFSKKQNTIMHAFYKQKKQPNFK